MQTCNICLCRVHIRLLDLHPALIWFLFNPLPFRSRSNTSSSPVVASFMSTILPHPRHRFQTPPQIAAGPLQSELVRAMRGPVVPMVPIGPVVLLLRGTPGPSLSHNLIIPAQLQIPAMEEIHAAHIDLIHIRM